MGFALAETALSLGAEVKLITGPTDQITSSNKINLVKIKTGVQMLYPPVNNNYLFPN